MPNESEKFRASALEALQDGEKGFFEFYKNHNGWRWRYRRNGNTIASGEGYANFADCERAIEIMRNCHDSAAFEVMPRRGQLWPIFRRQDRTSR